MWNKNFECSAVLEGCEIEFTNFCGLDCFGCVRKESQSFGFLDFETLKQIVSVIQKKWYSQIVLSWLWDVFLHKNFYAFVDYIFDTIPDIYVYVMTKGQSVQKKDIDTFVKYKERGQRLDICYSIFSLDEKKYKDITWGGDIHHLLEIVKYSHEKNINFNFEFFLDKNNISHIKSFQKFAKVFWKDFHYTIPHNWGGRLKKEKYEKIFDENILESIMLRREPGEICEAFAGEYVFFDYLGDIYKCGLKRHEKHLYLWNISHAQDNLSFEALAYNTCKNCSYYQYKTNIW